MACLTGTNTTDKFALPTRCAKAFHQGIPALSQAAPRLRIPMKRIQRLAVVLIPTIAAVAMLAWWFWQSGPASDAPPNTADAAAVADSAAAAVRTASTKDPARNTGEESGLTSPGRGSTLKTPPPAQTIGRSSRPSSLADTGPSPMSPEGQARIDAVLHQLDLMDDGRDDYALLARAEPPDPDWSPRLELLLQQAIDQHGRGLTGLEATRPHCTRTVCMLTAVSRVQETHRADANWQKLTYSMMSEPWFREAFFDARTTVTGDKHGALYVTYFIRK